MDAPTPSERQRFEDLVVRYQAAVCAVAYAVLRDRARSEEVAQEAFLVAWRRLVASPEVVTAGWVCGVARNLARNAARRRKEVVMEVEPVAAARDARDELVERETTARALAALAALPERYRDAVVVYYRGNESMEEVATALGISHATAKQRVHRGRNRLREALAPVEATLRVTRPGAAFTAGCVMLWSTSRGTTAAAAIPKGTWLMASTPMIAGLIAVVVVIAGAAIAVASGAFRDRASSTSEARPAADDPRAALRARFPRGRSGRIRLPAGFFAIGSHDAPTTMPAATTTTAATVTFDFLQAPIHDLAGLFADELDTPIMVDEGLTAKVDITVKDMPALDALDQALAFVNASRTEVAAIRLAKSGGRQDASSLGGALVNLSFSNAPIRDVIPVLARQLGMPIGGVGFTPPGMSCVPGSDPPRCSTNPDLSPHVTIDVHDVTAGAALEHVLRQTGLGFELTTGFVITPNLVD